jgi:hypothetical protein
MMAPYTSEPLEAFMAAQTSVGLTLGALLWSRKLAPPVSTLLFGVGIALAVVAPVSGEFLTGVGFRVEPEHAKLVLKVAAGCAALAALLTRREWLSLVALAGEGALWQITDYIQDSDHELAVAHLAFFGLLLGVHWRTLAPARVAARSPAEGSPRPSWSPRLEDRAFFAIATVAGAIVCHALLHAATDSADEWGYTFQAALFAKLHAYGAVPPCVDAFENYWVFEHMGRRFAQYTPGWPMFMAPFVLGRVVWLAGPASFGIFVAGVVRLTRRAAAGFPAGAEPPSEADVRAAGRFAGLATLLSATLLINAGSRFPHLFVAGMFVWSIEALFAIATKDLARAEQVRWGAVLGLCSSMMLAARPSDGATLGVGLFFYFVYAAARGRIGWRSVVAAAVPFAVVSGATLVILRLQVGTWFSTGYSLAEGIRSWAAPKYSLPKPNEFKFGIPIATGSYCWWPLSPAVGLMGIVWLRGSARRLVFVLVFGLVPMNTIYVMSEFGRGWDWGYGPRYALLFTVPMAIGAGVVLASVWSQARTRQVDGASVDAAVSLAMIVVAVVLGVVRIAPLLYPFAYADVHARDRMARALEGAPIHRAIVVADPNVSVTSPLDLTENLPIDLYPDQDVLLANNHDPGTVQCLKEHFPQRSLYRAFPGDPARLVPLH